MRKRAPRTIEVFYEEMRWHVQTVINTEWPQHIEFLLGSLAADLHLGCTLQFCTDDFSTGERNELCATLKAYHPAKTEERTVEVMATTRRRVRELLISTLGKKGIPREKLELPPGIQKT